MSNQNTKTNMTSKDTTTKMKNNDSSIRFTKIGTTVSEDWVKNREIEIDYHCKTKTSLWFVMITDTPKPNFSIVNMHENKYPDYTISKYQKSRRGIWRSLRKVDEDKCIPNNMSQLEWEDFLEGVDRALAEIHETREILQRDLCSITTDMNNTEPCTHLEKLGTTVSEPWDNDPREIYTRCYCRTKTSGSFVTITDTRKPSFTMINNHENGKPDYPLSEYQKSKSGIWRSLRKEDGDKYIPNNMSQLEWEDFLEGVDKALGQIHETREILQRDLCNVTTDSV